MRVITIEASKLLYLYYICSKVAHFIYLYECCDYYVVLKRLLIELYDCLPIMCKVEILVTPIINSCQLNYNCIMAVKES